MAVPVLTLAQAAYFCRCPSSSSSSSSSPLCKGLPRPCGAVQGSGPPSALLCGGAAGDRSGDVLGCASWEPLKTFPAPLGVPTWDPSGFGMWAPGKGLPSLLSPPLPATLHLSPVPIRVTPVSLSRFPSVCVRLLTGRIQVSSGNAFSLSWGVCGPFLAHLLLGLSCCSRGCSCLAYKPGWDE